MLKLTRLKETSLSFRVCYRSLDMVVTHGVVVATTPTTLGTSTATTALVATTGGAVS